MSISLTSECSRVRESVSVRVSVQVVVSVFVSACVCLDVSVNVVGGRDIKMTCHYLDVLKSVRA